MVNVSTHKHFILNGFNELGALRPVLFVPYFIMLMVSLLANSLLLYVIISQRSLHSPMYILMAGVACVDFSIPLFFVPNMLLSFLFDWRGISLIGCLLQMYLLHFVGAFHSTFLLWMALDRYFAICTPLYYHERMSLPQFLKFIIPPVVRNFLTITLFVTGQTKSGSQAHHEEIINKDRYVARIRRYRGPTLEPGLGLGLAGERLVAGSLPTGTRPGSARNGDVGPPSSRLTTCRKVHEGPVQCGLGSSRGRGPRRPNPWTKTLAIGTWNVTSLGGKES
ncbi:hypothetical protein L3Q82_004872 [Scortum barcoo]|uniref:Uncharacterized protein n=1 Tax=Scortum barcoo TaxID=214431 RepID=A0ACB8VEV3_9TELE|nr:hypothetical protein L3Q82_004872 [Scortum barcoo]